MKRYAYILGMAVLIAACQASEGEHCDGTGVCQLGLTCYEGHCRSVAKLRRQRVLQQALVGRSNLAKKPIKTPCLAPFDCPVSCPTGTTKLTDRQEDQGWMVGCRLPNKKWHGPFHHWFGNGNKRATGAYWEGTRSGDWSQWHRNGNKKSQGAYDNNKREGNWVTWHRNGQRGAKGVYRQGKRSGLFDFWSEKTGTHHQTKFRTIDQME